MDLQAVANYFNRMQCYDGYTGRFVFEAQMGLYDDNKRDSETALRRVISIDPTEMLPPRRVIEAAGTRFILGHRNPDDFQGSTIRAGYVAQEAPIHCQARTLGQITTGNAGFLIWAGNAWVKNVAFTEQSSKLVPQQHIHVASTEPVSEGMTLTLGSRLHIVRVTEPGTGGTLVCTCEEIPEPSLETVNVTSGTWNPATDSIVGSTVSVKVLRLRWQSLFQYMSHLAPAFGPDDAQFVIAKSALTVMPGSIAVMSDGTWRIASAVSRDDVWLCRATRHA